MKRRVVAAVLAAGMVLSAAPAVYAEDGSDIKVGIVTDVGGVNDGSFNQSAWEGLQRAQEDFGIEANYLESSTDADYIPNIETFIDEEYDMIICIGYQLADALREEAEANPDQKFAIVDDTSCSDLDNVTCLMFEQAQASYLVGYVAGLTTESDTIGFVLGMSTDTMNEFGYGYCAGALDANPDVTVLQTNANSFADTAAGKTAANNMIADGADVIFHAAGGTGLGVIDACKEAGIWAIGVDSDQSAVAPDTILTSAMKRVDNACYDEVKAVVEGSVESGIKTYTLADAGVDLAPTVDNLDQEVLDKVNEVKEKIIAGEVEVPKDKEAFEAAHGDVYQLAE
ncbi:MAG: BMP family ABC transporter substrate-binding protein [Eubacteriales bacterium]|nr:BMP family ABC transporter substrate-binding protein [Eubacteriales bacterium]